MNREDTPHAVPANDTPAPTDGNGSGKGADTALQALIRKRKLQADPCADAPAPPSSSPKS